jgi:hypothetical protein
LIAALIAVVGVAALIAVVCVEALTAVGTKLSATLVSIAGSL